MEIYHSTKESKADLKPVYIYISCVIYLAVIGIMIGDIIIYGTGNTLPLPETVLQKVLNTFDGAVYLLITAGYLAYGGGYVEGGGREDGRGRRRKREEGGGRREEGGGRRKREEGGRRSGTGNTLPLPETVLQKVLNTFDGAVYLLITAGYLAYGGVCKRKEEGGGGTWEGGGRRRDEVGGGKRERREEWWEGSFLVT
jgi:hypothetical protein